MKLSKEQIQFINTYLIKHEVIYVDIRQEMIDHIATAVEEKMQFENIDFYDSFKKYMIENKSEILKNNKYFMGFSKDSLKQFGLFLIKPYILALGISLFFLFKYSLILNCFSNDFTFKNLVFLTIMIIAIFQIFYFYVFLKKRFYSIEKIGSVIALIYYLQIFFLPIGNQERTNPIMVTIFAFLVLSFILFFIKEIIKFNKHRFNYI